MRAYLYFLFLLLPIITYGQKDYVVDVLPEIGDSYEYAVDTSIDMLDLKEDYFGKISWDFSDLKEPDRFETESVLSINGSKYKDIYLNADFRIYNSNESDSFYKIVDSKHTGIDQQVLQLGIAGFTGFAFGAELVIPFKGEVTFSHSPIKVGQLFSEIYSFQESLPATAIQKDLPGVHRILSKNGIDSFRIQSTVSEDFDCDAYGSLKLPNKTYDEVVRVKVSEEYTTLLEVHYALTDVWSYFPLYELPKELANVFGSRNLTRYLFYADGYHMPIVRINKADINFIPYTRDVIYYNREAAIPTSTSNVQDIDEDIKAYPNPTFGDITFERSSTRGKMKVNIYNVIGKEIESYTFNSGMKKLNVNISHLQKGTYIYSLIDAKGRKLTTKRLIVLNP